MFWKAKPEFQLSIKRCEVRNHDGAESRKMYYEINEYRPGLKFMWAVQWHPEFSFRTDENSRLIFSEFVRAAL